MLLSRKIVSVSCQDILASLGGALQNLCDASYGLVLPHSGVGGHSGGFSQIIQPRSHSRQISYASGEQRISGEWVTHRIVSRPPCVPRWDIPCVALDCIPDRAGRIDASSDLA